MAKTRPKPTNRPAKAHQPALKRRYLNESQRAMVAANIANMRQGNFSKAANLPVSPVTQEQAAKMMSVGERSVRAAVKVKEHATPELVKAVESGRIAVHQAEKPQRVPEHDFLKLSECAGALRCSERSILRLLQEGKIEGFRLREGSSRWLIDRASFLRFCTERKAAAVDS